MTGPGRARFVLVLTVVAGAIIGALAWRFFRHAVLPPGFARGNGRIEAVEIDVATKAPGRVREILVEEGGRFFSHKVIHATTERWAR